MNGRSVPWTARVQYALMAKTAVLLKLQLDGIEIFPTADTTSNLVFETNYMLFMETWMVNFIPHQRV